MNESELYKELGILTDEKDRWREMNKRTILSVLNIVCLICGLAACSKDQGEVPEDSSVAERSVAVSVNTCATDSFEVDYLKFGSGDKTMVILPGLSVQSVMGSADAIAQAYSQFADDYTVYLFEHRRDLPETYNVKNIAADMVKVFRELGLNDTNIFGASLGGMTGIEIALQAPDLVSKLVLGSTTACLSDEQYNKSIGVWTELARQKNTEKLYLAFGEQVYPEDVFEQSHDALIQAASTVTDEELARFIILAEGLKGYDVTGEIGSIECPVLAMGSQDDKVLGGEATGQIAELLKDHPDCESYVYEAGYGHASYDTAPDYKDRIQKFFDKTKK